MAAVWPNTAQKWYQDAAQDKFDAGSRAVGSMRFGAWGTDGTAPAVGNTALGAEAAEARVTGTISRPSDPEYRVVWEMTATADHLASGTGSIKEAGYFNQATVAGSILGFRGTHAELNIETSDRVEYTADLLLKDSSE